MKAPLPQSIMLEGLRSLVGANGWDCCILWKLSQDQRFLEWMGCCCSGAEIETQIGGKQLFPMVSAPKVPCRDPTFQHPRTRACDALADFPSSIPLDPTCVIHAQALISNQPQRQTNSTDSTTSYEPGRAQTTVLVPVPGGLVELFALKHIPEDPHIIEFIMSQCNTPSYEQQALATPMDSTAFLDQDHPHQELKGCEEYTSKKNNNDGVNAHHEWMASQSMVTDQPNFPWDLTAEHSRTYTSSLNLFSGPTNGDGVFEGSAMLESTVDDGVHQHQLLMATGDRCLHPSVAESSVLRDLVGCEKDSFMQEGGRAYTVSDGSDQGDEEDDLRATGRSGKRHNSKNLFAERKRRKKLSERLYKLRSLVPKITKMDRASILGDAIDYVLELQKQVKDLQDELEETNPEDDGGKQNVSNNHSNGHGIEHEDSPNSSRIMAANLKTVDIKQTPDQLSNEDKPQMEPQVEVRQVEGNEFFLKVLCEHKKGGFARLMEAMSSLGLEVTNVNVATYMDLVLNVFRVEKRDDEAVQAEQVRNSLLEITRNPIGGWLEPGQMMENSGADYNQHDHLEHRRRSSHHHFHYHHHQ